MSDPSTAPPASATRLTPDAYLRHLRAGSEAFAAAVAAAPAVAAVPTCPDWRRDDLLWHLAEVQWFWGTIVRRRLTDLDAVSALSLDRPAGHAELAALAARAAADLAAALAATPLQTPVWTWAEDDRTAGFVLRRQAHEVLIHRLDAELTAGTRAALDPELAADGVDEALRIMFGPPPWGTFAPGEASLRVRCHDTGHTWRVTPGRFTGTAPSEGTAVDEPLLHTAPVDDGRPVAAAVEATAADLDCLLWNRPPLGPVERSGDGAVLALLDAVRGVGVQ